MMKYKLYLIVTTLLLITGCRTTRTVTDEAVTDSLSTEQGMVMRDSIVYIANVWRMDSVMENTTLTVTLNINGDTARIDRVSTIYHRSNTSTQQVINHTTYKDRWRNINHRYYRTITKTVTKELNLWQRIEIAGFWILVLIVALFALILAIKNKA